MLTPFQLGGGGPRSLATVGRPRALHVDEQGVHAAGDVATLAQRLTWLLTDRPLAERMRPRTLDEFVGQQGLVAPGRPLRKAIEQDRLQSIILWGPPGTGKTTLARLIAKATRAQHRTVSSTSEAKRGRALSFIRTEGMAPGDIRLDPAFVEALISRMRDDDDALVATPALRLRNEEVRALQREEAEGRVGGIEVVLRGRDGVIEILGGVADFARIPDIDGVPARGGSSARAWRFSFSSIRFSRSKIARTW